MRIAVFGLGYVGTVSSACLVGLGHEVIGVDVSKVKVDQINLAQSPISEHGLAEAIEKAVSSKKLRATQDVSEAVNWADASLICVGTPSRPNGSLDTSYVECVISDIGAALKDRNTRHTVVVRSTLLPGTTLNLLKPILESSAGKSCGPSLGLAYNPEFLREGTAMKDFANPPYTIIGGLDKESADTAAEIYSKLDASTHIIGISDAEMVKYSANAFHALKITFANEIGMFSQAMGVDGHQVMKLLTLDTQLNISPVYLKPGFAYGGSCLPKDLRAILYASRQNDVELPLLQSLPISNSMQILRGINMVLSFQKRKIGILGFSFKAGTDDLRESPVVMLAEALLGKGLDLRLYDHNVNWAKIMGANKKYIETSIPHISQLMVDTLQEVVDHSDVIIIGNNNPEFTVLLEQPHKDKIIIDLVRLSSYNPDRKDELDGRYYGICW